MIHVSDPDAATQLTELTAVGAAFPADPETGDDTLLAPFYSYPAELDRPWVRANMISSLDGGATDDGFTTVDLSLTYEDLNEGWRVSAWGTNVFDEGYFQSGIAASGILRSAVAASPAVYGVTVGVDF